MIDDIYRENIMDHYNDPRNKGKLLDADIIHKESNPFCGDEIEMSLKFSDGKIINVMFNGQGCAISQATASMLTEHIEDKGVSEVKHISANDIVKLISIPLSPVRLKCALLSLDTIKNAITIHEGYGKNAN